jgi:AmmeMemoRadiSam system protein A
MPISKESQRFLLQSARFAIHKCLGLGIQEPAPPPDSREINQPSGCFVTLEKDGQLRGCIGIIEARRPLLAAVEENAVCAAFRDHRFPPVTVDELPQIRIEISVLTPPRPGAFCTQTELLNSLVPGRHGVILSKGRHRATFLPQVWSQLPDKKDFLDHLCIKAGLSRQSWRNSETSVEIYEVIHFSEQD